MIRKSDLPFGSEFSPSQVTLAKVLEFAQKHGGDWHAFEAAVRGEYFESHSTSDYNKGKLANNTKLGMIAYGIIDRNAALTQFGQDLYKHRDDESRLYEELAKHILLNLHGMTLIQCVLDIQAAGETVDLVKLREWLEERGIHYPRGGKHPSMMRLWLEKAGVFDRIWQVNQQKLKDLIGTSSEEIEALAALTPEQRCFLKALVNMGTKGPHPSNEIEKLATASYGIKFNEKNLPKQVLYPLQDAGYITMLRGTKKMGRGAKPFMISPTKELVENVVLPLLAQLEKQVRSDIRPLLRKSIKDIRVGLRSKKKYIKGLALEALAFKLMRLIDLTYVATRLRGTATGGAEVDVIFETARLVFSRWQVQCKNTSRVALDDVAKEVGLTHMLKSNVIVIVSTGKIGPEARKYANKIMADSNLCIVMVDGKDIDNIEARPAAIVDIFNREAKQAMELKALEI